MLIAPTDRKLLDALLSSDEDFGTRLTAWQDSIALDDVAGAAVGWLPLLAERLALLDLPCRDRKRLAGIWRFAWTRNQRAVQRRSALIECLAGTNTSIVEGGEMALRYYLHDCKVLHPIKRFTLYVNDHDVTRVTLALESCGWVRAWTSVLKPFVQHFHLRDQVDDYFVDLYVTHAARLEIAAAISNGIVGDLQSIVMQPTRIVRKADLLFSLVGREWHRDVPMLLPSLLQLLSEFSDGEMESYADIAQQNQCSLKAMTHLERLENLHPSRQVQQLIALLKLNTPAKREYADRFARTYLSNRACDVMALYFSDCQEKNLPPNPVGFVSFFRNKLKSHRARRECYSNDSQS